MRRPTGPWWGCCPIRTGSPVKAGGSSVAAGIALCGHCGATVNGARSRAGTALPVLRPRPPLPGGGADRRLGVEVAVARLSRDDAVELLRDDKRPDIEALRTEAAALRSRLGQLGVDFADGVIDRSALRSGTARARSKLATVEAQIADAGRVNVLGELVLAEDVQAVWEALSVDRRRGVVEH